MISLSGLGIKQLRNNILLSLASNCGIWRGAKPLISIYPLPPPAWSLPTFSLSLQGAAYLSRAERWCRSF